MTSQELDRRDFLKGAVVGGAAATAAVATPEIARAQQGAAPAAAEPAGYAFLNLDEAAFVEALVDHMIPADEVSPKGTDLGINIYIDRAAYEHFRKTETFPDPTVLVMELFRAEKKDPDGVLTAGNFEGKRIGLEVAVKDSQRPGGGVPWAYYVFQEDKDPKPNGSAPPMPDAACYECHKKHASKDKAWVQFYPVLRDRDLTQLR